MERTTPPSEPSAEDVFADFLERIEAGEVLDFATWVAGHPDHTDALQRIHRRWRAMTVAFASLSQGGRGSAATTDSASFSALLGRLQSGTDRWSRYAVSAEIARGAMGRVVAAWDQELRRSVALKIQRGDGDDGRVRRRFVEEAQIAAQLDHPGIVPIHELGMDDAGRPFFAMRLVQGRDLGEVLALQRTGREGWSRTRVLHVLLRVCEAMAYAHHKGVVHRDLKPANVMVGNFGETYVMDWGLARVLGSATETSSIDTVRADIAGEDHGSPLLTRHGDVVGTPAYMAPEQAAGGGAAATTGLDVYAIGAILYDLLAGQPPYQATTGSSTADEVIAALRQGPPAPLPDSAPGELRAICERAMARLPEQRYPSVDALAADLRAFLELRVVSAYATGRFAELRKWIARNRALSVSSLLLVLALLAGMVATGNLWWAAERAQREALATAAQLARELDRSQFRNARQALRLDDPTSATETLRRQHLAGQMPRATHWALLELAERNPVLASRSLRTGAVAFSRATATLLAAGQDGRIHVLAPTTLATLRTLGTGPSLLAIAASPVASHCVTGASDGSVVCWDLATGEERWRQMGHIGGVECVVYGADGTPVTCGRDGRVLRWEDPAAPSQLGAVDQRLLCLLHDPRSDRWFAGSDQGYLFACTNRGQPLWKMRVTGAQLLSLAAAGAPNELWVGTNSHTIEIVDLERRAVLRSLPTRNGSCRDLVRAEDGSVLMAGWWRIDRYVDDTAASQPLTLGGAKRIDLEPQLRLLASARLNNLVESIDIADGGRRKLPEGSRAVGLSGDGKRAFVFSQQQPGLVVLDVDSGQELTTLRPRVDSWILADGDGSRVAIVGTGKRSVHVLDVATRKTILQLDGPAEAPFHESAAFRADGQELAVVVGSDRIRRHAIPSGEVVGELALPERRILRIAYSLDGRQLGAIARGSPAVQLFDLSSGSERTEVFDTQLADGQHTNLSCLALDEHAERIAVGSWAGTLLVRDRRSGKDIRLQSQAGTTWSIAFVPNDPRLLLAATGSGNLTAWDLDTAEACYQDPQLQGPVAQLRVSRDGRTLICRGANGAVLVDLEYRERHLAGTFGAWLEAQGTAADTERGRALRGWVEQVLARPWPRWR